MINKKNSNASTKYRYIMKKKKKKNMFRLGLIIKAVLRLFEQFKSEVSRLRFTNYATKAQHNRRPILLLAKPTGDGRAANTRKKIFENLAYLKTDRWALSLSLALSIPVLLYGNLLCRRLFMLTKLTAATDYVATSWFVGWLILYYEILTSAKIILFPRSSVF